MINYFFEEIDKVEIHSKTSEWLKNLIQTENKKLGEINYIFCDDDYLLKVNQDYLDHDYYGCYSYDAGIRVAPVQLRHVRKVHAVPARQQTERKEQRGDNGQNAHDLVLLRVQLCLI